MHYNRVIIAGEYRGILAFWTWVPDLNTHAELISQAHLRSILGLADGDTVEFSLDRSKSG